jgi:predicted dehydrogenase
MSDSPVKIGVIGVGALGQHHTRIYKELAGAKLVGVFDSDAARAEEIATTHGCRAFSNMDDLAAEIDAASVVVPTDLHFEVADALLRQGRHLLIEKPIARTTREAEELVALAEKHGCILQVGHVERFNPVMGYLEEVAQNPRFIEAHRLASYPPPRPGLAPRGTEVSVVLDLMIHDLEIVLHLVKSKVKEFHAVGVSVLSPTADIANARLIFENGCVANVTASRISPERMRKLRVFLSDAYVSLDYQEQAGKVYRAAAEGILMEDVPIEKREPLSSELESFVSCVATRDQPVVSGRHASDALKLAVEITQFIAEASG